MKTYSIDVHWDVAKNYKIKATSEDEAVNKMWERIRHGDVCVWQDGFQATDDVEVESIGEED